MWLTALYPIKHPRGVAMPGDVFEGDAVLISTGLAAASLVAPPPAPVDTTLSITAAQISDAGAGGLEVLKKGSVPEIAALVSGVRSKIYALGRFPLKVSILGNSFCTPNTAGWFYEFCSASRGMLLADAVLGVAGNTSAQMLARVGTVPMTTDACVVFEGLNDASGSVTPQQHTSNIRQISDALLLSGVLPIIALASPKNSSGIAMGNYRAALAYFAKTYGLPIIDPFGGYFAPSQGWASGTSLDGTHPTEIVYRDAGRTAWDQVRGYAMMSPLRTLSDVYGGTLVGALFQSSTAGLGTGWSKSGTAVATIEDASVDGYFGNWQTLSASAATSNSSISQTYTLQASDVVGSTWAVRCAIKSSSGSANFRCGLVVRWLNSGGAGIKDDVFVYMYNGTLSPRVWEQSITQPANAVSVRVLLEIRTSDALAYTGSMSIAEPMLFNLSGLAGL